MDIIQLLGDLQYKLSDDTAAKMTVTEKLKLLKSVKESHGIVPVSWFSTVRDSLNAYNWHPEVNSVLETLDEYYTSNALRVNIQSLVEQIGIPIDETMDELKSILEEILTKDSEKLIAEELMGPSLAAYNWIPEINHVMKIAESTTGIIGDDVSRTYSKAFNHTPVLPLNEGVEIAFIANGSIFAINEDNDVRIAEQSEVSPLFLRVYDAMTSFKLNEGKAKAIFAGSELVIENTNDSILITYAGTGLPLKDLRSVLETSSQLDEFVSDNLFIDDACILAEYANTICEQREVLLVAPNTGSRSATFMKFGEKAYINKVNNLINENQFYVVDGNYKAVVEDLKDFCDGFDATMLLLEGIQVEDARSAQALIAIEARKSTIAKIDEMINVIHAKFVGDFELTTEAQHMLESLETEKKRSSILMDALYRIVEAKDDGYVDAMLKTSIKDSNGKTHKKGDDVRVEATDFLSKGKDDMLNVMAGKATASVKKSQLAVDLS